MLRLIITASVVLLFSNASNATQNNKDADNALQQGHELTRSNDLDGAILMYQKALSLNPNFIAAKSSLEQALRNKSMHNFLQSLHAPCNKPKNSHEELLCARKHFIIKSNTHKGDITPISPLIIKSFYSIADSGEQVLSINLNNAQGSNKYFGNFEIRAQSPLMVQSLIDEGGFCGYVFYGTTSNGVSVVEFFENGGGSGVFGAIKLFKISQRKHQNVKVNRHVPSEHQKQDLVIEEVLSTDLGDRANTTIQIKGTSINIQTKDRNSNTITTKHIDVSNVK